jgi:hypothetical protein
MYNATRMKVQQTITNLQGVIQTLCVSQSVLDSEYYI